MAVGCSQHGVPSNTIKRKIMAQKKALTNNKSSPFLSLKLLPELRNLFLEGFASKLGRMDRDFLVRSWWTLLTPNKVDEVLLNAHQLCTAFRKRFRELFGASWRRNRSAVVTPASKH